MEYWAFHIFQYVLPLELCPLPTPLHISQKHWEPSLLMLQLGAVLLFHFPCITESLRLAEPFNAGVNPKLVSSCCWSCLHRIIWGGRYAKSRAGEQVFRSGFDLASNICMKMTTQSVPGISTPPMQRIHFRVLRRRDRSLCNLYNR